MKWKNLRESYLLSSDQSPLQIFFLRYFCIKGITKIIGPYWLTSGINGLNCQVTSHSRHHQNLTTLPGMFTALSISPKYTCMVCIKDRIGEQHDRYLGTVPQCLVRLENWYIVKCSYSHLPWRNWICFNTAFCLYKYSRWQVGLVRSSFIHKTPWRHKIFVKNLK